MGPSAPTVTKRHRGHSLRWPVNNVLARQLDSTSTDSQARGFDQTETTRHLEECAASFMHGATLAVDPHGYLGIHQELHQAPPDLRGFAYEGAAMTAFILDRLVPGPAWRLRHLLAADGYKHRYLIHVGAGWGMAKLHLQTPKTRWGMDPLLRWLALDGIGFHDCFFATRTARQALLTAPPQRRGDDIRAQGRGRALWFVHGANLTAIRSTIASAHPAWRHSLWAGVGLAAAYAGTGTPGHVPLKAVAGEHAPAVQQGMTFGHAARAAQRSNPAGALHDHSFPETALERAEMTARHLTTPHATLRHYRCWQHLLERETPHHQTRQDAR